MRCREEASTGRGEVGRAELGEVHVRVGTLHE